jgi:hypothetical protein
MKTQISSPPFLTTLVVLVVVMLALQCWVEYRLLPPINTQVQKLEADFSALRNTRAALTPSAAPPQIRLQDILARLAQQPNNQVRIERMHQIAAQHAVSFKKASYQKQSNPGAIFRHEIQADLGGSYPDIRQFLGDLLVQDEALAVESLEFSRPAGSVGVRAQVRLVMFSNP